MPPHPHRHAVMCQKVVLITVLYMIQNAALAAALYASQWYWKQPYHTSGLSGAEWAEELVYGHPEHIHCCLSMHVHVFLAFVNDLQLAGLKNPPFWEHLG